MSSYPAIEDLLPHAPPIRMLESLVDWAPGYARCAMQVRPETPFVQNDALSTLVTLEIMAQAVAACLGYQAYSTGEGVRVGMVIASRSFELLEDTLQLGDALDIEVQRVRGNEDMSHFDGTVRVGEREVARAQMTLYHAERPPA